MSSAHFFSQQRVDAIANSKTGQMLPRVDDVRAIHRVLKDNPSIADEREMMKDLIGAGDKMAAYSYPVDIMEDVPRGLPIVLPEGQMSQRDQQFYQAFFDFHNHTNGRWLHRYD